MNIGKIVVKACGCEVAVRFKGLAETAEGVDVLGVLDRHAREIEAELRGEARNG